MVLCICRRKFPLKDYEQKRENRELVDLFMLWVENLYLLTYETCDAAGGSGCYCYSSVQDWCTQQLGSSQLTPTATSSGWPGNSHTSHQSCRKLHGSNVRATSVFSWLNEPKGQSWVWNGCVAHTVVGYDAEPLSTCLLRRRDAWVISSTGRNYLFLDKEW